MLTDGMRRQIRARARQWLHQRCRIEREQQAISEYGEPVVTWVLVADDVPCRLVQAGSRTTSQVSEVGSAEGLAQAYRLAVTADVALENDMRVVLEGQTYYVVGIEQMLTDEVFRHGIVVKR